MNETVLVVAAHSDDEALGCGGTIARHVAEGCSVHLVIMTDGVSSRNLTGRNHRAGEQREKAAEEARNILGVSSISYLGFPDNRMDSIALLDVVQALEKEINRLSPDIIYTHHNSDLNIDHRVTFEAVITACRPVPGSKVQKILSFEVLSSTEWRNQNGNSFWPDYYVNISNYLDTKCRALEAYSDEMREEPHSRSISNVRRLAELRGNSVGLDAAEGFVLVREIY